MDSKVSPQQRIYLKSKGHLIYHHLEETLLSLVGQYIIWLCLWVASTIIWPSLNEQILALSISISKERQKVFIIVVVSGNDDGFLS